MSQLDESNNSDDLLLAAKEHFEEGQYAQTESLLNQLILRNNKTPDVFFMLGTVYYNKGKFNKAIRAFKRALELDPSFTDASVGLSILLNDLGRYEEGREVFADAKEVLKRQNNDPVINQQLAKKHEELGDLYTRYERYDEALEQFYKMLNLSTRKIDPSMRVVTCLEKLGRETKAISVLKALLQDYPKYIPARVRLGQIYFDLNQVATAVETWEIALKRDPENVQLKQLLRKASSIESTQLEPLNANEERI